MLASRTLFTLFLFNSWMFSVWSMEKAMEKFKQGLKQVFSPQNKKVLEISDSSREIAKTCVTGHMYLEAPNLKTFIELQYQDEEVTDTAGKSNVSNYGNPINPRKIMAKIGLINQLTSGLTADQEKKVWGTMPRWIPISFLKKNKKYVYEFHVKKITQESVPVILRLVKNPNFDNDPYDFLKHLEEDYLQKCQEILQASDSQQ